MENTIPFNYLKNIGDEIVAESKNPQDRYHLGKLILKQLREHPGDINQIDGSTDELETNASVLERSTATARAITSQGLKVGDVVVLMSPNNLDVVIPFLACLYEGFVPMAIDYNISEKADLQGFLKIGLPKMAFCEPEKAELVKAAALELGTSFDASKTLALMHLSSGTTGSSKAIVHTHQSYISNMPCVWYDYTNFPRPIRMAFLRSSLQWMSASYVILVGAIFVFPRVQFSDPYTKELAYKIINKYKGMISGTVRNLYGMTEAASFVLLPDANSPSGSSGKALSNIEYKLVKETSGAELGTNEPGELWIRGEFLFKEYYNDEDATRSAFAPGGWFKTGDIRYKDEQDYYYFVERIKLLMKYGSFFVSPVEIEEIILQHPEVFDVAVCGYLQPGEGDLPTACVVKKRESTVIVQEIKDLVKDKLEDQHQLRGGVIFVEKIPLTATSKVDRVKLKELVRTLERE